MITFVYPLIKSKWNEEIKYSLRSLNKYFKDSFEIYIIGYKPEYINNKNIKHIPFFDSKEMSVASNSSAKLKIAREILNKPFIWIYDDVYLLKDSYLNDLKKRTIIENLDKVKNKGDNTTWKKKLWNTYDALKSKKYSGYNFATHLPIYLEPKKIDRIFDEFKILEGEHLFSVAYPNVFLEQPVEFCSEKIGFYSDKNELTWTNDKRFLNHDDKGLTDKLKEKIKNLFPSKSRFEI